jgi:hypothetical protein
MIMVVPAVTDETHRKIVVIGKWIPEKGCLKQILGRLGGLQKRDAETLEKYENLLENFVNGTCHRQLIDEPIKQVVEAFPDECSTQRCQTLNQIRRKVIDSNSENCNTECKILPKDRIITRRRFVTSKIITNVIIMTNNSTYKLRFKTQTIQLKFKQKQVTKFQIKTNNTSSTRIIIHS